MFEELESKTPEEMQFYLTGRGKKIPEGYTLEEAYVFYIIEHVIDFIPKGIAKTYNEAAKVEIKAKIKELNNASKL